MEAVGGSASSHLGSAASVLDGWVLTGFGSCPGLGSWAASALPTGAVTCTSQCLQLLEATVSVLVHVHRRGSVY